MNLTDQIALINSIVKKDRDFTIKDYIELVKEMDLISETPAIPIIKAKEPVEKKKYGDGQMKAKYLHTYKIHR